MKRHPRTIRSDRRAGAAAVEFALIGPVFVMLLIGLVVYGSWFWMAQNIQHLAAEGARAAVAGLTPAEQKSLAEDTIRRGARAAGLPAGELIAQVAIDPQSLKVTVAYDASDHPLMALSGLVPTPPRNIVRAAEVRIGGY